MRSVRITNISIDNFKNVGHGEICLENKRKDFRASILGLYGQNGSGKTALVDAIALLKHVLCGNVIPVKYADFVNEDATNSRFLFEFKIVSDDITYRAWYEFSLGRVYDDTLVNMDNDSAKGQIKAEIYDEVMSYSYASKEETARKSVLIDTRPNGAFLPKNKYLELTGDMDETDVIVSKRVIRSGSRSFIFSREMINLFRQKCKNTQYLFLIESLLLFGNRELFVINTENAGLISLNALPISFKYKEERSEAVGNLMVTLNAPATIPLDAHHLVLKLIENMNIVLDRIIPGLTIGVMNLGDIVSQEGKPGKIIQLMSLRNGKEIPFQYESEGIKKIVSILQLLIVVYNNSSITVAVDELDAGIFEYLLGEILQIISEKGKGQLVFTSHNLRPLETIDKGFIAFTTTNTKRRYLRMTNVKGNNNLRDFYYRDIVLGGQSEQLYETTNNYEIALAFKEAGDALGM